VAPWARLLEKQFEQNILPPSIFSQSSICISTFVQQSQTHTARKTEQHPNEYILPLDAFIPPTLLHTAGTKKMARKPTLDTQHPIAKLKEWETPRTDGG
jgi:hypothetical protein